MSLRLCFKCWTRNTHTHTHTNKHTHTHTHNGNWFSGRQNEHKIKTNVSLCRTSRIQGFPAITTAACNFSAPFSQKYGISALFAIHSCLTLFNDDRQLNSLLNSLHEPSIKYCINSFLYNLWHSYSTNVKINLHMKINKCSAKCQDFHQYIGQDFP